MTETLTHYADASLALRHGDKTEDELLQRIWNLADDVKRLAKTAEMMDRELRSATQIVAALVYRTNRTSGVLLYPNDLEKDLLLSRHDSPFAKTVHLYVHEPEIGFIRPNPNPDNKFALFHEALETKPLPWSGVYPPGTPGLTHGRHCPCTPCRAEDWTQSHLAPCGMHGEACPDA